MGEANVRMLNEAKTATVDFAAMKLRVPREFTNIGAKEDDAIIIVRLLLMNLVNAKWPKGLTRTDGKIWAAWEDMLEDQPDGERRTTFETTVAVLAWAQKLVNEDGLAVQPWLAASREAFADYLNGAIADATKATQSATP
jgi:hypothetical protein